MLTLTLVLSMNLTACALPQNGALPEVGAVFESQVASHVSFQEVIDVDSSGAVSSRWFTASEPHAPREERMGYQRVRRSFLGMVHLETVGHSRLALSTQSLRRAISGMEPGDEIEMSAPYSLNVGGDLQTTVTTIQIRLEGCEAIRTPAGVFDVINFRVQRPTGTVSNGGQALREQVTTYSFAPEVGWPVRVVDHAGEMELVNIHDVE